MNNINKKLADISAGEVSNWPEQVRARRENRAWLKKSAIIALKVLEALKAQGLTQKDLAGRLGVSPQQVSKIVKGHENLTLETITRLEQELGIQLLVGPVAEEKEIVIVS
ncbi:Helix-turn-helix [Chitinophaga costaii]|uniref:Helix-turn-helix n=1 Tax=Chitinophaga costaii TaxID=1335309 RepID=A0A1C4CRL6_9BACT|nr:helix-turn-helix transcriptional regulator [Chitinophaga costaii]PUZ26978.1 helix-turn-helix domain-containing protein [Chitinophaga costaii]SCC21797.1 Helix-turn-helix [Chitinophaga costaii]